MQRKKLLSVCVAMALSSQTWAADTSIPDSTEKTRKSSKITCPANIHSLSKEQLENLSAECRENKDSAVLPWAAAGLAAVATGIAIYTLSDDDNHHHNNSPVPDDGGDTPVPPDDGGDTPVPPDDGGDTPVPPDDGGDTPVPPDDGGDTPVPPDDGGDTPVPPDDGGDTPVPDDGGDTPVPPDDGGDTPVKHDPVVYKNDVTWDQDAKTVKIRETTFTYSQNADGSYTLTAPDGLTTIVKGWTVHDDSNTVIFDGVNTSGGITWSYDDDGLIHITKEAGVVVDGTTGTAIDFGNAIITDQGGNTALNGGTVMTVEGDNITLNNDGKTTAIGEGSVVGILTGDDITINNNGETEVDGGTAVIINGDNATLNTAGDSTITNGGTGSLINGDNARVDNQGTMSVDGENSTGSKIVGDGATIKQEGDLYVSGGAHGIDVDGNDTFVSNKGNITVIEDNSIGMLLDGDGVSVINMGDLNVGQAAAGENAIGIQIDGDNATFVNVGDISATNAGTGVSVAGDKANISLAGGLDVGDFSTGLDVSGNNNNMTLATYELNVTGQKATGVNVSGDGNTIEIAGSILVDKDQKADNAQPYFFNPSTGVNISGNNNDVTLDGQLTVVADSETTVRSYASYDGAQEHIAGIVIAGDDNTFTLNGGVHFVGEKNVMDDGSKPSASRRGIGDTPLISVDGHSSVYLNGESTISGEFPLGFENLIQLSHGAELEIGADATFDMSDVDSFTYYYRVALSTISIDSGAKATNNGEVELKNIGFAAAWNKDSTVINNGSIGLAMYDFGTDPAPKVFDVEYGGIGVNNGTLTTKMMNQHSVLNYPAEWNLSDGTSFNNRALGLTGMLASYSSSILNGETGIIDMYGRGSVGMLAIDKSTADNEGQITLDTLWVDENDETSLRNNVANSTAKDFGVGMASGTDAYNGALTKATATNHENGVITVYNAGAGMAAYGNTNTVINQGTINLEKNENYNDSLGVNKLVGMAVYHEGTAINDQTGVININAENGQAFYNDGTGLIINYGTICTFGVCQGADEYNPTDNYIADLYDDGDVLSSAGETVLLSSGAIINGDVTSAGAVKNGTIRILENGALVNESSGTISSAIVVNEGGALTNEGVLNTVTLEGGTFNNNGTLNDVVKIEKNSNAVINNTGSLSTLQLHDGTVNNSGIASARVNAQGDAVFNNLAGGEARKGAILYNSAVVNNAGTWKMGYQDENNNAGTLDIDDQSTFNNSGKLILDNSKNAIRFQGSNANATLYNTGEMTLDAALGAGAIHYDDGASQFINKGVVDAKVTVAVSTAGATESDAFLWNQDGGVINFDKDNASAVKFTHNNYVALNDGVMNISGNNAVAMEGDKNAQLVNNGVINLGTEGTTDTGLIGMQLDANATADAVIENNGTINIYANDSFAFSVLGTQGHIVNNGTVVIADGVTGSGLIKQGDSVNVEGVNGNNGNNTEVHYTDYTLPEVPNTSSGGVTTGGDATGSGSNNLNGYVVGTNVDGSAGKLKVNNASMNGVGINTGFAAGTADTTVSFDNVVEGSNLTDADAITSTSVVWTAKGSTDASGNVDVTMSKNAYTDVATDASVNDVAKALDAGYTNNELYTSLNVGTTAELNSALKQVSGSQATTVFREARVLSNRFSMLADAAPKMGNGLAFNVVAKGDPRAELGNNTEYDMLALRKTVDLSESQSLSLEYGIARLDGDGAQKAGDNGVTGGYSQFFGLKHQMFFDNGMNWNNALRYDVHNLDSSRSVAYGDVSKTADTDVKQQYLEFRSEGAKTFEPREGLKITPYAGVKLRHTLEGGYQERNAGDFNLSMNSGSETAVDSIVGLKLDYAGKGGWSANATLEGGPNLSYSKSQRTASLAGAGSQHFNVDDGQKGGGINSLASVGVKYSSKESSLNLDAYHWKEDGISDKGVMLNFKKTF
ncbi:autotransporter domain-containing protein [Escherichia coli]|nr:autotransporter domain-containing protein [Escherichia coli]EEW0061741.1 autotransporter domain-containing protein [Escherichia coli]EFA1706985.1 autotransporter domain-containing protein [Escherichia coli]EFG1091876.1 autotransporter domain-containing protein [Escherichia coli]